MPTIFSSPEKQPIRPLTVKQKGTEMPPISSFPPGKTNGQQKSEYFGAYQMHPNRTHFATQGNDEIILLILRKHPITQIPWLLVASVLIIIPPLFFTTLSEAITAIGIPNQYAVVLMLFWYLATFAFIFSNFLLWYFNVNIITNQRILDIDFSSLLIQEVNGTRIENIEQVTFKAVGVFSTLFDYGDVFVETAGAVVNIEFIQVPHPKRAVKLILELMGQGDTQ